MPSHAGRWTIKRMMKLNFMFDEFNSILLAPIYKIEHVNISIIGISNDYRISDRIMQIARTSYVVPEANNSKNLPNNKEEGVFSLKSYDEDMIYGMGAILSALGFVVYYPKMIEVKEDISIIKNKLHNIVKFPSMKKYKLEFLEFVPNSIFAENKIVSTNMSHALEFCQTKKQPEFHI